jgi:tRNA(Arg) A34 adenosine deaminase TadA
MLTAQADEMIGATMFIAGPLAKIAEPCNVCMGMMMNARIASYVSAHGKIGRVVRKSRDDE